MTELTAKKQKGLGLIQLHGINYEIVTRNILLKRNKKKLNKKCVWGK
jgi:hypothetical protein